MKTFIILVLLLIYLRPVKAQITNHTKVTILVTSFDYFNDPPVNSSHIVAKYLQNSKNLKSENINIVHCADLETNDVFAKEVLAKTLKCMEKSRPDMIISLGEGECNLVKLETKYKNGGSHVLDSTQPPTLSSTLPLAEMYCAKKSSANDPELKVSIDAGVITCNNLSFRMAAKLKDSDIPFGFIHVPRFSKKCTKNSPTQAGELVESMVIRAADTLRAKKNNRIQPMNLSEAESRLKATSEKPPCEKDFYVKLKEAYESENVAALVPASPAHAIKKRHGAK